MSVGRLLRRIVRTGRATQDLPATAELQVRDGFVPPAQLRGSVGVRHVDAGSCNGCELEIHALNNAFYDVERFGVHFVASPRHADALLVTGPVSRHMETALRRTYEATPAPRMVIAAGTCACDGGEFGVSYASCAAVANVIPVDVTVPGCPPTPEALLRGILRATEGRSRGRR